MFLLVLIVLLLVCYIDLMSQLARPLVLLLNQSEGLTCANSLYYAS